MAHALPLRLRVFRPPLGVGTESKSLNAALTAVDVRSEMSFANFVIVGLRSSGTSLLVVKFYVNLVHAGWNERVPV